MRIQAAKLLVGVLFAAVFSAAVGCDSGPSGSAGRSTVDMFAPTGMRIHPIFTQIVDWNKDGKSDGIEAQLEFQDQFGDPTKASGRVLFELFDYRRNSPDPRGLRVAGPWVGSLATLDEQHERWNTTLRTYRFQLNYPEIRGERSYVLTAIFELAGGGRFFDRVILPGHGNDNQSQEHSGGNTGFFPTHSDTYPGQPTSRSSQP